MDGRKKRKKTGMAVMAWLAAALVIVLMFIANMDTIINVLHETEFFQQVFGTEPQFIAERAADKAGQGDPPPIDVIITEVPAKITPPLQPAQTGQTDETPQTQPENTDTEEKDAQTEPEPPEAPAVIPQTTTASLFFITLDNDGSVSREQVARTLPKSESPLTAALQSLLEGPTPEEEDGGLMTLIPEGTRLISAAVSGGVAVLNFSEEFEYNKFSAQGYLGQLMQVVFTAASFPTVKSVQFLIEGQRKNYLGSEGVWIGTPLTAASLDRI